MYKIVEYKGSNFKGLNNKPILVEESFVPKLNIMNELLKKYGLICWVTNSFRKEGALIKGAIVKPAGRSNHKVGHAIDFNLQLIATGEWFNTAKMRDKKGIDNLFLEELDQTPELRWGGKFTVQDEVHMDDGLNVTNPKLWDEIYMAVNAA